MLLSVVVPCFNEKPNIDRFRAELIPPLESLGCRWELIGVDDGSSDGSSRALETLPGTLAVRHPENRGLGAALRTGFSKASGNWIATIDADLTFHPKYLKDLLAKQKASDADMVSGSPFLSPGGLAGVSLSRRIPSALLNTFYRGLFTRALTSYTGIFRLYRASTLKALELRGEGFEINAEIAARFYLARKRIEEIPVPLTTRTSGESKLNRWRELRRHAALIARLQAGRDRA